MSEFNNKVAIADLIKEYEKLYGRKHQSQQQISPPSRGLDFSNAVSSLDNVPASVPKAHLFASILSGIAQGAQGLTQGLAQRKNSQRLANALGQGNVDEVALHDLKLGSFLEGRNQNKSQLELAKDKLAQAMLENATHRQWQREGDLNKMDWQSKENQLDRDAKIRAIFQQQTAREKMVKNMAKNSKGGQDGEDVIAGMPAKQWYKRFSESTPEAQQALINDPNLIYNLKQQTIKKRRNMGGLPGNLGFYTTEEIPGKLWDLVVPVE